MPDFYQNSGIVVSKPGMTRVLWAPLTFFETIPQLPTSGIAAGDTATLSSDFVFDTNMGWIELYNELFKGSDLGWKNAGDEASPNWTSSLKGQITGMTPQLTEQFANLIGLPGILLVFDSDGSVWAMGTKLNPVFAMFDGRTDVLMGSGAKGTGFEFKSAALPYLYTGAVDLMPFIYIEIFLPVACLLLESGGHILCETGDYLILE